MPFSLTLCILGDPTALMGLASSLAEQIHTLITLRGKLHLKSWKASSIASLKHIALRHETVLELGPPGRVEEY